MMIKAKLLQIHILPDIIYYWCPVKLFDEFSLYKFTGQPMS